MRDQKFVQAVLVADAVNKSGSRGMDWEAIASALDEWHAAAGLAKTKEGRRRTAYRAMDALESTLLYECIGDGRHSWNKKRVRRQGVMQ